MGDPLQGIQKREELADGVVVVLGGHADPMDDLGKVSTASAIPSDWSQGTPSVTLDSRNSRCATRWSYQPWTTLSTG